MYSSKTLLAEAKVQKAVTSWYATSYCSRNSSYSGRVKVRVMGPSEERRCSFSCQIEPLTWMKGMWSGFTVKSTCILATHSTEWRRSSNLSGSIVLGRPTG